MENDNDQGPKPAKISKFTNGNELSTITENTEPNSTTPSIQENVCEKQKMTNQVEVEKIESEQMDEMNTSFGLGSLISSRFKNQISKNTHLKPIFLAMKAWTTNPIKICHHQTPMTQKVKWRSPQKRRTNQCLIMNCKFGKIRLQGHKNLISKN